MPRGWACEGEDSLLVLMHAPTLPAHASDHCLDFSVSGSSRVLCLDRRSALPGVRRGRGRGTQPRSVRGRTEEEYRHRAIAAAAGMEERAMGSGHSPRAESAPAARGGGVEAADRRVRSHTDGAKAEERYAWRITVAAASSEATTGDGRGDSSQRPTRRPSGPRRTPSRRPCIIGAEAFHQRGRMTLFSTYSLHLAAEGDSERHPLRAVAACEERPPPRTSSRSRRGSAAEELADY
jgi:hypothetical protein